MLSTKLQILLVVFLGLVEWSYTSSHSANENYFFIESPDGKVLEATKRNVYLRSKDNSDLSQKWKLQYVPPEEYVIINVEHDKPLDVEFRVSDNARAIIYYKHKLDNQRFHINSDGTLVAVSDSDPNHKVALTVEPDGRSLRFKQYLGHEKQSFKFVGA